MQQVITPEGHLGTVLSVVESLIGIDSDLFTVQIEGDKLHPVYHRKDLIFIDDKKVGSKLTAKKIREMQNEIKFVYHNGERLINARNLHHFLEVLTPFNMWIHRKIQKYGFEIDTDYFCTNLFKTPSPKGGRPIDEYLLTLDTAKEIAMTEETPKGREVRQFFIWCQKALGKLLNSKADENEGFALSGVLVAVQRNKNIKRINTIGFGDPTVKSFQHSNYLLTGMNGQQIKQWASEKEIPKYIVDHSLQDAMRYLPETYHIPIGNSMYSELISVGVSHERADEILKKSESILKEIGGEVGETCCLKNNKKLFKSIQSKDIEQLVLF